MAKKETGAENQDQSQQDASQGGTASAPAAPKFKFRKTKDVTLPLFKFDSNKPRYFKITEPIFVGKIVDDKKEPPHMTRVIDLESGEAGEFIIGAVLLGILNENYPDNGYVGKNLEIVKRAPEGARKYSLWNVAEIEVE